MIKLRYSYLIQICFHQIRNWKRDCVQSITTYNICITLCCSTTYSRDQIATRVIEQFQKACGFSNVIGAIDGTHIKIRAPKVDPASYINRNAFYA